MKKTISLLSFLLFFQFSFAQSSKTYLLIFKDKKNSPFSVSQPEKYLSERSIARRQKQNIAVNASDLPVNPSYVADVKAIGVNIKDQLKWLNAITIIDADEAKLDAIRKLSFVKEIILTADISTSKVPDAKFDTEKNTEETTFINGFKSPAGLDYGPSFFQSNQIGIDCIHNLGFMGQGMVIAVLDAGFFSVDILPAFDSLRINNQLLGCRDIVTGDTMVFEDFPHGMNVLSCMVGNLPGQLIGTAPKAKYWLLRTEDAFTETLQEEVNWLAGAEFADSVGADIINSSLGYNKFDGGIGDHYYSDMDGNTTIVTKAADWAASKGIFVTTSAGNAGGPPWFKITAPADADSSLTVGAVDSAGNIAGFSSRGLTFDGRIKPNTCARGVQAVIAANSGGITNASGTSFSSPITAGAVACLWQSTPGATNMQLLQAIHESASQYFLPDSIKGFGIPDFCVADSILTFTIGINSIPSKKETALTVYPNPFQSGFMISYYSDKKGTIRLELFDVSGKQILVMDHIVTAHADNKITFSDLSSLSKGIYTLRLISSDKTYISKIVKQ